MFLSCIGKADTYLTYYTWYEQPENFFDDEYHTEVAYGTIDIFSKGNFKDVLKEVKKVLKKNKQWLRNVWPWDWLLPRPGEFLRVFALNNSRSKFAGNSEDKLLAMINTMIY